MKKEEIGALVAKVRAGLNVSRVSASRVVRGRLGETRAEFEADFRGEPMSLREAVVAQAMVSREAEMAAIRASVANGNITPEQGNEYLGAVRSGYSKWLQDSLEEVESRGGEGS